MRIQQIDALNLNDEIKGQHTYVDYEYHYEASVQVRTVHIRVNIDCTAVLCSKLQLSMRPRPQKGDND